MRFSALQHPPDAPGHSAGTSVAQSSAWLTLVDQDFDSRVVLAPGRGGLTRSFSVAGRELLYLDEATFADPEKNVRGGMPVLFPSPGRLNGDRWQRDGSQGLLPQHGFARNDPWQVLSVSTQGAACAELQLVARPDRYLQYPWRFKLALTFQLRATTLRVQSSVTNLDDRPLPYALGFHPYFAVHDKTRARVLSNARQAYDNVRKQRVSVSASDLQAGLHAGRELDLHLLDHSRNACALQLADGAAIALRASQAFARWVIWTLDDRPFVCVEPWTASADALNTGELLQWVAPGATGDEWMEICWRPAPQASHRDGSQGI